MREAVIEPAVQEHRPEPTTLPAFAKWPVLSVAGVVALVHLVLSVTDDYWIDEIYMLAAGKYHPDWGYVDQPPVTPLLAAAMDWLGQGSILVLRLPAVAATVAGVIMTAVIAREFGGDRRAQLLSAGAYATALWLTLAGHWLTPYTIEPLLWIVTTWLLVRWIRLHQAGQDDDRLLLAVGAVVGLTAQTKFQVFMLCAALLVSVVIVGPRDILRRPMLWVGAALAMFISAPTLIWQAANGWPQLQMGAQVASESELLSGGRDGTAVSLVIYAGVAGTVLLLVGVWRLLFSAEMRPYRFFAVTYLLLLVLFVATAGRPYYLTGLYGVLIAAGAVGFQRRREVRSHRYSTVTAWLAVPLYAVSALTVGGLLVVGTSLMAAFGIPSTELVAQEISESYRAVPTATREHTAVVTKNYFTAAIVDGYSPQTGTPHAYSPSRGYGYFDPPTEQSTAVLFVGPDPGLLRPYFGEVHQVRGGPRPIWLCTGKTEPWARIWPQIRNL